MEATLSRHLRRSGRSVTAQRLQVFNYLLSKGAAPITDIITCNDTAHPASIYRTLALFRQLDVIRDVVIGGRRMVELTDRFDVHHHHLTCARCGRTTSVDSPNLEKLIEVLGRQYGFSLQSHAVEMIGLCQNCREG